MEQNKKSLAVILLGVVLLSSSLVFPLILIIFKTPSANIIFTPNYMKSYPGHTAWLLAEISSKSSIDNASILIGTNESVDLDYKVWDNSEYEKIVELFVNPNSTHLNNKLLIQISIINEQFSITKSATIEVIDWGPKNITEVIGMKEVFISYFSSNLTSFGINESTLWEGLDNAPQILIVEHYLFRSENWELGLSRHITIAPHDWIKVYLRPRNQIKPIWAGMIESWSTGNHSIIVTEPPISIFR